MLYEGRQTITSSVTPEWAVLVEPDTWKLSWLPEAPLSREEARLGMMLDELLSNLDLVHDPETHKAVSRYADQLGIPLSQALLLLVRRVGERDRLELMDKTAEIVDQAGELIPECVVDEAADQLDVDTQPETALQTELSKADEAAAQADRRADDHAAGRFDAEYSGFYRQFVPTLVAFLIRHGATSADAADLAQETLVDAYRAWPRITAPASWCYRVAFRKFIHSKTSRREAPHAERPGEQHSALLRSDDSVIGQDTVDRALAQLPPRQRQVMALTMFDFTPTQIAEELKISPVAVRGSLRKARQALKKFIDNERNGDRQ
ncbi:RNA polymerase sigma factor [Nocardia sp. NPDC004711]